MYDFTRLCSVCAFTAALKQPGPMATNFLALNYAYIVLLKVYC
jgi:hypothetical protein